MFYYFRGIERQTLMACMRSALLRTPIGVAATDLVVARGCLNRLTVVVVVEDAIDCESAVAAEAAVSLPDSSSLLLLDLLLAAAPFLGV